MHPGCVFVDRVIPGLSIHRISGGNWNVFIEITLFVFREERTADLHPGLVLIRAHLYETT